MVFSDGFPNLGSIMGYTYKRMGGGKRDGGSFMIWPSYELPFLGFS